MLYKIIQSRSHWANTLRKSFSINYLVLFIQYPKILDKLIFTTSLVIYLQSQSLIHSSTKFLKLNLKVFFKISFASEVDSSSQQRDWETFLIQFVSIEAINFLKYLLCMRIGVLFKKNWCLL